jgi:hypothetical protein
MSGLANKVAGRVRPAARLCTPPPAGPPPVEVGRDAMDEAAFVTTTGTLVDEDEP